MNTKGRMLVGLALAVLLVAPAAASSGSEEPTPADPVVTTAVAPPSTVAVTTTTVAPPPPTTVSTTVPTTLVAPVPTTSVPAPAPGSPAPEAAAAEGEDFFNGEVRLTVTPQRLRYGRPVTAEVTFDPPDGFTLPADVDFYSDGEFFIGTAPLNANFRARLVIQDPPPVIYAEVYQYPWMEFPEFDSVGLDISDGFGVEVDFSTTPAQPAAGGFAVVSVQVTNTGPVPPQKSGRPAPEGGLPNPSGSVFVRSGGNVVASGPLDGSGRATIPLIVPASGAPLSVAYEGDNLFVPGASTFTVIPGPPVAPPPTSAPPGPPAPPAEEVVAPVEEEEAVAPTTVPPPPEEVEDDEVIDDEVDDDDATPVDDDDGEEVAAAPTDSGGGTSAQRTSFVRSVPTRDDIEWSAAHVAGNMALALLLLVLVAIPATLVDNTLEENYQRIFGAHPKLAAWVERAEAGLTGVPNGVLLVGLSIVAALIFGQLEFDLGWNATSAVLLAAMALVVAIVVGLHDLIRLPYLRRRAGDEPGRLGVYPFALILAVVLVVLSKLAGFQPGFVFGVLGGLALSDAVEEHDDGASLGLVSAIMLGVAFVAWWLWTPVAARVVEPDPGLWTLFLDAFLATLWLTCLQAVVFGLAPVRFLDGEMVKKWNGWAWIGLWGLSVFVMVQCFLHPSAGRWGGLDDNTMRSALSVFVVFFALGVAFWAWFRFRPDPNGPAGDADQAEVTVSS